MQLFDPNNPNEKKKIIAAAVLFVVAMSVLGYVFFGGSSKPSQNTNATALAPREGASPSNRPTPEATLDDSALGPLPAGLPPVPAVADASRNIFAFYEPPPPTPKLVIVQTPTPTPTPPMTISQLNPPSVFARTADFTLEVTGEKFTPAVRVTIDGRELSTRFISTQQLFTTVPAALISSPGTRQVKAQTGDAKLYSNVFPLNVMQPPLPNYNYVGVIIKPRGNDTAVLQDKGSKDLLNVQRGDVLGNRFRVSSISEREVVLIDTNLKIRHTLAFTVDSSVVQPSRPPSRRVESEEP
jgi:IPT/TIG domain